MKKLKLTLKLITLYIIDKKYRQFINLELRCEYVQWQDENRVHQLMMADWFGHIEKVQADFNKSYEEAMFKVKYFANPLMY